MSKAQLDLFSTQQDLFPSEPASYAPSPDRIRVKLETVLAELRRAGNMPWDRKTQRYHQQVFPQMTSALPPEEAAQYRLAFEAELARFG
jgi:hypothetical protein